MCAYNASIPQPTDRLRVSQGDLLGNFAATSGGLGTMLNPNQGYIQFPNQGGTPTVTPGQVGIYAQNPPAAYPAPVQTGVSELFLNKNSFKNVVTTNEIPFTASILSTATPTFATPGWSYLPSGIILQWGFFANIPTNTNVVFSFAFPNDRLSLFLSDFNAAVTNTNAPLLWSGFTTSQFTISFVAGNGLPNKSGYYLAIGF